jgi:hypothetical protein
VPYQVNGVRRERLPSAARLCAPTRKMPNDSVTDLGDINVKARDTRSACQAGDFANSRNRAIARAEYECVAGLQDAFIAASPIERAADPGSRPGQGGEHAPRAARPAHEHEHERKGFPGSFPGPDESLIKSLG